MGSLVVDIAAKGLFSWPISLAIVENNCAIQL